MGTLQLVNIKRAFGSLNDGTAPTALGDDDLALARNVYHARGGSVAKRPGRLELARVASFPENLIAPPLQRVVSGGTLAAGTLSVRITHQTMAGETDDLFSTGSSVVTSLNDAVKVWCPFHIKNRTVALHVPGAATLTLDTAFASVELAQFADDTFNGYYVYSRDPVQQDETNEGVNPQSRKLFDRTNYLAKVLDYSASGQTFTLDRELPFSLTGQRVDILMPDRNGLPVHAVNVYVSMTGGPFYLAGAITGPNPTSLTVTAVDTSAKQSPATRYVRTAPTLTEVDATDTDPVSGIVSTVQSGIVGGEYVVRYAWLTDSRSVLDTADWPDDDLEQVPRQTEQATWPSSGAIIAIRDGKGIRVVSAAAATGAKRAQVIARKVAQSSVITFTGVTNPSVTHRAYAQHAAIADPTSLSPSAFRASGSVAEYRTTNANGSGYVYPPGNAGYSSVAAVDWSLNASQVGEPSDKVTQAIAGAGTYKHQHEFQLDGAQLASTTLCLVARVAGWHDANYSLAAPGALTIRHWNEGAASWVTLKSSAATTLFKTDDTTNMAAGTTWTTHRLAFAWTSSMAEGGRAVFDIAGTLGAKFALDIVSLETYQTTLGEVTSTDIVQVEVDVARVVTGYTADGGAIAQRAIDYTIDSPLAVQGLAARPNTTAQWPVQLYAHSVADTPGQEPQNQALMVGCADAVFVEERGSLIRVYQQTGPDGQADQSSIDVSKHDWQFSSHRNRVFFTNAGIPYWLRFDGVQTHIAGLEDPNGSAILAPGEDESPAPDAVDPCSRFIAVEQWRSTQENGRTVIRRNKTGETLFPGTTAQVPRWEVTSPDGVLHYIYDYRLIDAGELSEVQARYRVGPDLIFEGIKKINKSAPNNLVNVTYTDDIIKCLSGGSPASATGSGTSNADDASQSTGGTSGLIPVRYGWFVKHVRAFVEEGRGFFVRSGMTAITSAVMNQDRSATVLTVPQPTDPQVTELEFYRNISGSSDHFLVGTAKATDADANGNISVVDDKPDSALSFKGVFETGRPPGATAIVFHQRRNWFVPRDDQEKFGITNLVSENGLEDPEGHYVKHLAQPPMPKAGALTALAPYENTVLIHSLHGIVAVTGTSDDINGPSGIQMQALLTDTGAMSQQAWCNADNLHFYMSPKGPMVVIGREAKPESLYGPITGTLKTINWQEMSTRFMRCVHYRARGVNQVWFVFSDRADGRPDKALVFDVDVGQGAKEPRRLWATWTELYAHSVTNFVNSRGEEHVVLGDAWGRIHRHDVSSTDNGIFIDAEWKTKLYGEVASHQPRFLYPYLSGNKNDIVTLNILKDMSGSAINPRPNRLNLGGRGVRTWGDGTWRWGDAGVKWGVQSGEGYKTQRGGAGHVFQQFQLHFAQVFADMPPGTRRAASFEASGFGLAVAKLGPRKAVSP